MLTIDFPDKSVTYDTFVRIRNNKIQAADLEKIAFLLKAAQAAIEE